MIIGAHTIIYSTRAVSDREFLRDVLKLPHADAGEGWLIFGLPPAEVAFHPGERNDRHEFFLMCQDVAEFVVSMRARGVECEPPEDHGWGILTQITLPSGGKLKVYQPRHARPQPYLPQPLPHTSGPAATTRRSSIKATPKPKPRPATPLKSKRKPPKKR